MRVAITGASGFIGSNLCHGLRSAGHEPVAVVRASSRLDRLDRQFEVISADVRDQDALKRAFQRAEAVIHCAALVDAYANPWEARSINFIAAFNVCHAAVDSGVAHVVQMSSAAVYARDNRRGVPLAEDKARIVDDPPVYDTYSINKAAAEKVVLDFGEAGRFQASVLRMGAVYGPGDRLSAPVAAAIRAGRVANVGRRPLHFGLIHVDDLVSAVAAALERPPMNGRAFNLDGPAPATFQQYLAEFSRALGVDPEIRSIPLAAARAAAWAAETVWNIGKLDGPAPLNRFSVELLAADFILDTSRARSELGWEPKIELATGLDTVACWLETEPAVSPALPMLA
ncbi:MAG TPA: NAD(P)-dependent oxidoreductase [Dehalococcoidia bacterium]|nr:NAD(P)-dependent oxidoreductase [Dehalococcoidia bacterium]